MTFVVDASLAVKWLVREADSADALLFAEWHGEDLHAPDLLHVEVMGALVRLANQRAIPSDQARRRLDQWAKAWDDGAIRSHRVTSALTREAARMAIELGHSIKDCVYLALAAELGCPLVTCDVKFRERAGERYAAVRLPGEAGT